MYTYYIHIIFTRVESLRSSNTNSAVNMKPGLERLRSKMAMFNYVVILLLAIHIFVTAESRLVLPQRRELFERFEDMKEGFDTKEFAEASNSKDPLNPIGHDPHHNNMNP